MEHEPMSPLVSDDELEAGGPTHGSQASAWRRISTAAVLALALSVLALAATAAVVRRSGSPADSEGLADKVGLIGRPPPVVNAGSCGCSWITNDNCQQQDGCAVACRAANPSWTSCASSSGQVPVNAGACQCSWIPNDNCQQQDGCAVACRGANPWGPCTR